MDLRSLIETALAEAAAPAGVQRARDFPPEEIRLRWEDGFCPLGEGRSNPDALAQFGDDELAALRAFDTFIWSLPPEPDPMWHRNNLDAAPWPEIRTRAAALLVLLRARDAGR